MTTLTLTTPTEGQNPTILANTNQWLSNPASAPRNSTNLQTLTKTATLGNGQYVQGLFNGASGAVRQLQLTLDAANMSDALQNTFLEIRCDNQRTVEVPVGQFFGTGPQQLNTVNDFYRSVDPATKTLTAYWVMPYQNAIDIRVINKGSQQVTATLSADKSDYAWNSQSMYFHANYRAEDNIPAGGGNNSQDWNYVRIQGTGVYVGDTLSVTKNPISGTTAWWGEGDEKIWVDGSPASSPQGRPRVFGTGSEDYYNYAYSSSSTFSHPFAGQPQSGANNGLGTTVNSRLNSLDAIPFNNSLQHDQEIIYGNQPLSYKAASFWYGQPGAAAWRTIANVRDGVDAAINSQPYAGQGQWQFLGSKTVVVNTSSGQGTNWDNLGKMTVGNAGHTGLGISGNGGYNLCAIGNTPIFSNGLAVRNDDVSLNPGGTINGGTSLYNYVVCALDRRRRFRRFDRHQRFDPQLSHQWRRRGLPYPR